MCLAPAQQVTLPDVLGSCTTMCLAPAQHELKPLTLHDTSATKLRILGLRKGTTSSSPSIMILPRIVPCSRIFLVNCRVSIPEHQETQMMVSYSVAVGLWPLGMVSVSQCLVMTIYK